MGDRPHLPGTINIAEPTVFSYFNTMVRERLRIIRSKELQMLSGSSVTALSFDNGNYLERRRLNPLACAVFHNVDRTHAAADTVLTSFSSPSRRDLFQRAEALRQIVFTGWRRHYCTGNGRPRGTSQST
jgi:hypothetical protein